MTTLLQYLSCFGLVALSAFILMGVLAFVFPLFLAGTMLMLLWLVVKVWPLAILMIILFSYLTYKLKKELFG